MRKLLLLLIILTQFAVAKEQKLLTAANDHDQKVDTLALEVDDSNRPLHLLHRRTGDPEMVYSPEELAGGVVLKRKSGKELLILTILRFDPEKGGEFNLKYLYNGVPPEEYRSLSFSLKRDEGRWSVFSASGAKPVKSLYFQSNIASIFGVPTPVGIRAVKVLF